MARDLTAPGLRLRGVRLDDAGLYVRLRCDPVMMAELGGPLPRESIDDKVRRDTEAHAADTSWIYIILPDDADDDSDDVAAGTVVLWSHVDEPGGPAISEIGWMVAPEFQGRGLGKRATRALLQQARDDGRWGLVHAFPGVTNAPSNGICRSLGFTLVGEQDVDFADRVLRANHWQVDP